MKNKNRIIMGNKGIKGKYYSPSYWTQLIQILLFNHVEEYLKKTGMSKKDFASRLGVSKGYVSQILNGDFDHRLSKLVELALASGYVPKLDLVPIEMASRISDHYNCKPLSWSEYGTFHSQNIDVPSQCNGETEIWKKEKRGKYKVYKNPTTDQDSEENLESTELKNIA